MKVYIVLESDYEGDVVRSIHSTKELAEDEAARLVAAKDYSQMPTVLAMELDPELTKIPEEFEKGNIYHIRIKKRQ